VKKLRKIFKKRIKENYPLYRLGILSRGKVSCFLKIRSKKELLDFLKFKDKKLPFYVIGNGSNTVASDRIIKAFIIKLEGEFKKFRVNKNIVIAGAGITLKRLVEELKEKGLSGIEFLHQIPGTVGGAIKMNAGCFGKEIMNYVREIEVLRNKKIIKTKKMNFSYRKGPLKKNDILLFAVFKLKKKNKRFVENKIRKYVKLRAERNLYHRNSKGSVFLNTENKKAYEVIEELCFKNKKIGRVKVWEKNPNFFIWEKGAKGEDFFNLYKAIKKAAKNKMGLNLKTEINFIGL